MYMHQNVTDIHTGHVIQLYVYDNNKLDHKIIKWNEKKKKYHIPQNSSKFQILNNTGKVVSAGYGRKITTRRLLFFQIFKIYLF
jgi:hypothetical protein